MTTNGGDVLIVQRNCDKIVFNIKRTGNSVDALETQGLTPRERQLLLLLDKQDALSLQAVAKILDKINLEALAQRGLLTFECQSQIKAKMPLTAKKTNILPTFDKFKGVNLHGFLENYTDKSIDSSDEKLSKPAFTQTINKTSKLIDTITTPKPSKNSSYQEFEDIMIAQSLLDF